MSFRSELADVFRVYGNLFSFFRLVRVGVGAPRVQRLHDRLVRRLAERSYDLLRGVDTGTRYEVVAAWARRPGQMIIR